MTDDGEYHHGFSAEEQAGDPDAPNREERLRDNVVATFTSPAGRIALAWLYERVKMGEPTFVAGQPDVSAYREGRRSVLLEIMAMMELDDQEILRRAKHVTTQLERTQ